MVMGDLEPGAGDFAMLMGDFEPCAGDFTMLMGDLEPSAGDYVMTMGCNNLRISNSIINMDEHIYPY